MLFGHRWYAPTHAKRPIGILCCRSLPSLRSPGSRPLCSLAGRHFGAVQPSPPALLRLPRHPTGPTTRLHAESGDRDITPLPTPCREHDVMFNPSPVGRHVEALVRVGARVGG